MSGALFGLREAVDYQLTHAPYTNKELGPDPLQWPKGSVLRVGLNGGDINPQLLLRDFYAGVQEVADEIERPGVLTIDTPATIDHELEHIHALGEMELLPDAFGLVIAKRRQRRFGFRSMARYTIKAFVEYPTLPPLQSAAVAGFPEKPSSVDLALIRKEGFSSVTALGDAIASYNRSLSPEKPIPLPKSYRGELRIRKSS